MVIINLLCAIASHSYAAAIICTVYITYCKNTLKMPNSVLDSSLKSLYKVNTTKIPPLKFQ